MSVSAASLLWIALLPGQVDPGPGLSGLSPLFGPEDPLTLTVETPWVELTYRPESGRSRDARVFVGPPGGELGPIRASVAVRGKSRLAVCDFPPLTLRLAADQVAGTLFEADRQVHLTPRCKLPSEYLEILELELLAYRIFALVSDAGLRTRRLDLVPARPGRKGRPSPVPAFLVEDLGLAAARSGLAWLQPKATQLPSFDPDARALFALFQFLIGNTDWSIITGPPGEPCCHNAAIFGRPGSDSGWMPIPFDLDSAGLVDAPYSVPGPRLGIKSTRERLYRGHCDLDRRRLEDAIARFERARPAIFALVEGSERLKSRAKKRAVEFLTGFFEIVTDPERLAEEVLARCRER